MQRVTLLLATAMMLGGGTFAVIEGCSSSDTATPATANSSSSSSSSGSVDESSSSSSSSSSSGSSVFDATTPTTVPGSNPQKYTCGTVQCDAGFDENGDTQVCCQQPTGVTGTVCGTEANCKSEVPDAGLEVTCDESADCSPNRGQQQACCYYKQVRGNNGDRTTFQTVCGSTDDCSDFDNNGNQFSLPILCHSTSDCTDAGVVDSGTAGVAVGCNLKTCDGFRVYVCGSPIGCQ